MIFSIDTAQSLAADLAGARVDPNEAQKALAYLRSKRDPKEFFKYLQAIVKDGRVVIRSGQTLGYYRDLLAACERHLRPLQDDYEQTAQTFAWSLRLLRYYRAVPDAVIEKPSSSVRNVQPEAQPAQPEKPAPPPRAAPQIPDVGASFTGKVIAVDESAVLVEIPGFTEEQAVGVIKADDLGGKRFAQGNMVRVEVVDKRELKNGRVIVELKPGERKKG